MWWLPRGIECAAVAVLACAEERTIAALLALIERAIVHLHFGVCGGVRERPLHACGAVDDVAALESVKPCKPDVCVSSAVKKAKRSQTSAQEKEKSRIGMDGDNGRIEMYATRAALELSRVARTVLSCYWMAGGSR
jgi:hypothetical protein